MSEAVKQCEKGEDPKTCTAEQIRKCHGDTDKHSCASSGCNKK